MLAEPVPLQPRRTPLPAATAVTVVGLAFLPAAFLLAAATGGEAMPALGAYVALGATVTALHARKGETAAFGLPNVITLVRGAVACLLLAALPASAPWYAGLWLAGLAVAFLLLDGLDGYAARRLKCETAFGARFDMETDALFLLLMAVLVLLMGKAGLWVLLIGLMRYGFVVAGFLLPRLAGPLPPSLRRKAVCVLQMAVLALLMLPDVTSPLSDLVAGVALAALCWSFACDLAWLWRRPTAR
jgi:phosphatidylglycerophosphate synthase